MTTFTINHKLDKLAELESIIAELKAESDSIKDELKEEMVRLDTDCLITDRYVARWTAVSSSRFDTKRFKEDFSQEIYKLYCKEVASHRWSVSA